MHFPVTPNDYRRLMAEIAAITIGSFALLVVLMKVLAQNTVELQPQPVADHYYECSNEPFEITDEALLTWAILEMVEIDRTIAASSEQGHRRVPAVSINRARHLAELFYEAAQGSDHPFFYALEMLIIGAYETGWDEEAIAPDGGCGITQVMPRDAPGFSNRPYCEELMDPLFAIQYTRDFLRDRIRTRYGFWNLRAYNGSGAGARAYDRRHHRMLHELLYRMHLDFNIYISVNGDSIYGSNSSYSFLWEEGGW